MIERFPKYLREQGKAEGTIQNYSRKVAEYMKWHEESFGSSPKKIFRANVLDYKSYMKNIKKISAVTINTKIAALAALNEFLIAEGIQEDIVISKKDYFKVQKSVLSPNHLTKQEVEAFRQKVLEEAGERDYAIVTIMAYMGLRRDEVVNLKLDSMSFQSREVLVWGKGGKQRTTYMNDKVVNALKEYLKTRKDMKHSDSEYVFISRQSPKLTLSRVNQIFNGCSDKITPHSLRHFCASNMFEVGYSAIEVAAQLGHQDLRTVLIYSHPSTEKMKEKSNLL